MIVFWCRIINSILVTFVGKNIIIIAEPDRTHAYLQNIKAFYLLVNIIADEES